MKPQAVTKPPSTRSTLFTVLSITVLGMALIGTTGSVRAQPAPTAAPAQQIQKGRTLMDAVVTRPDSQKALRARQLFVDAAQRSQGTQKAWAHYYAAYANYRLGSTVFQQNERRAQDQFEQAARQLKTALEMQSNLAEAHALLASVYGQLLQHVPERGSELGPKSARHMERALNLAPENPRVLLLKAISEFYTPEKWGGSKEDAHERFQAATQAFEREATAASQPSRRADASLSPTWGHAEAYAWLGVASMKLDQPMSAKKAFENALEVDSEYAWVKDRLLPQLRNEQQSSS